MALNAMNAQRTVSSKRATARVATFSVTLAMIGSLLLISAPTAPSKLPLNIHYGLLVIAFFLAGSAPLILEVGSQGFSLSMTEIPLILGLLSTQRSTLVACGTFGWFLSRIFDRRMAPVKLLFNVPLTMFEMSVAIAVLDRFNVTLNPGSATTWLILLAAICSSIVTSTTAVNCVILLTGNSLNIRQALRHSLLGCANALGASVVTIAAIILLQRTLLSGTIIGFFTALVILPLRRYAILQRRFESLEHLHEFTAGLSQSIDLHSTLESAATQCASVLRAENAEVILPNATGLHGLRTKRAPYEGDEIWKRVFEERQAVVLSRLDKASENYRTNHQIKDLIAAPLIHNGEVLGVFVARDRLGDVSSFDGSDVAILSTMANQTTVTLQNLRLIDELRTEAATRQHQALHDELTGLPNRASLMTRIDRSIKFCDNRSKFAVALVDLNRFKDINDTLGHHIGDRVLIEYARRLRTILPPGALAARLGGDEFAFVSSPFSTSCEATKFASLIAEAFHEPVVIDGLSLQVDGSTGVAIYPDHGTDRAILLQRADVAMYAAKDGRAASICVYDPSQEQSTIRQLSLLPALSHAVTKKTLEVYFQPKASSTTGEVLGVEALARWSHPTFGRVSPDEFIPLAEQAGLIQGLTTFLTDRSLEICGEWLKRGRSLSVAVNLDASSLQEPGFSSWVSSLLQTHAVPPKLLTFEITERVMVSKLKDSLHNINTLRRLGVQFSIDDFGTGYSSLSYISKLPVDEIKIDKAFILGVEGSPHQAAIVRAVTDIAHSLGMRTVAEGVETQAAWDALTTYGVDIVQGYYLGVPMPPDEFETWHDQQTSLASLPSR
jgi:diguanylate cyclase (GGDEF)-like protein